LRLFSPVAGNLFLRSPKNAFNRSLAEITGAQISILHTIAGLFVSVPFDAMGPVIDRINTDHLFAITRVKLVAPAPSVADFFLIAVTTIFDADFKDVHTLSAFEQVEGLIVIRARILKTGQPDIRPYKGRIVTAVDGTFGDIGREGRGVDRGSYSNEKSSLNRDHCEGLIRGRADGI